MDKTKIWTSAEAIMLTALRAITRKEGAAYEIAEQTIDLVNNLDRDYIVANQQWHRKTDHAITAIKHGQELKQMS